MTAALALDTRPVALARVSVDAPYAICVGEYPITSYTVRFESGETVTMYEIITQFHPRVGINFTDIERAALAAIHLACLWRIKDRRYSARHILAVNGARRELEAHGYRLDVTGEMA